MREKIKYFLLFMDYGIDAVNTSDSIIVPNIATHNNNGHMASYDSNNLYDPILYANKITQEEDPLLTEADKAEYMPWSSIDLTVFLLASLMVSFNITNLVFSFLSSMGNENLTYMNVNGKVNITQLISVDTSDLTGLILGILYNINMLCYGLSTHCVRNSIWLGKQSRSFQNTVRIIWKSIHYLVTLFSFSILIACITTTNGDTIVEYGPASPDIPIINYISSDCWYCGVAGTKAGANVWHYYYNTIENCVNYNSIITPCLINGVNINDISNIKSGSSMNFLIGPYIVYIVWIYFISNLFIPKVS